MTSNVVLNPATQLHPLGGARRVEVLTRSDLPRLLPAWRRLEALAERVPLPVEMFAGPLGQGEPFLPAVFGGEELVGLWPLRLDRRGPLRVASRLGRELQPYDGLLLHPGVDGDEVVRALFELTARRCPADLLELRALRDDGPLHRLTELRRHVVGRSRTWTLDTGALPGPEQVLRRLSKSRRKSLRRKRRALERQGAVVFRRLLGDEARAWAVRRALALKRAWLE